ncbi:MAG: PEP-utilizing enzyme [Deltaproteobacteria bacterium]|nr:PEP-utilizing enzyme [Deltaproteobacteria bacterium]
MGNNPNIPKNPPESPLPGGLAIGWPGPLGLGFVDDWEKQGPRVLGQKGWAWARMARAGAPVPPGFIIPAPQVAQLARPTGEEETEEKDSQRETRLLELWGSLEAMLTGLERHGGVPLGAPTNRPPLLLALRSSPVPARQLPSFLSTSHSSFSTQSSSQSSFLSSIPLLVPAPVPSAMLMVGLTWEAAARWAETDPAAWDALARLWVGWGEWFGAPPPGLDRLEEYLLGEDGEQPRSSGAPAGLAQRRDPSQPPENPREQFRQAVSQMARRLAAQPAALMVQAMVYPTLGGKRGWAGTYFTRHPATGLAAPYGHGLAGGMGEDLKRGRRMSGPLELPPPVLETLTGWGKRLEAEFHDALELDFGMEGENLWLTGARPAGRTAVASFALAEGLLAMGLATVEQILPGLDPAQLDRMLHPMLDPAAPRQRLAQGLGVSPGSAVGQVVFTAAEAVELAGHGQPVILVRNDTTPEDMDGLKCAQGILTTSGGATSHAAVVARGMGKCCVVGAQDIHLDEHLQEMTAGGRTVARRGWVSLDGSTGEVFLGQLPVVPPRMAEGPARWLAQADGLRRLGVMANADTPQDAAKALELGAQGIGLCRTEHMFFQPERILLFRKMILARSGEERRAALEELKPLQEEDFLAMFRVLAGRPMTVRLLDPPLHEFLPQDPQAAARLARAMGLGVEVVRARVRQLREANPMLGHRGCRLGVTDPDIYIMQTEALVGAACRAVKGGVAVHPEIMVPLISTAEELALLRQVILRAVEGVLKREGMGFPVAVGTMIETPRAALRADDIARHADFFSFGTNDLTQMTYGFSRDDAAGFLPAYAAQGLLAQDPFVSLDTHGVGELLYLAVTRGRGAHPALTIGICGEHGGDPASVRFAHFLGLNYVSCSPYRIPIARLAAAQAALEERDHG